MQFGTSPAAVIPGRIAGCRSYPENVEIEIRAGFCDPDSEVLTVLERSELRHLALNEFLVQKAGSDR